MEAVTFQQPPALPMDAGALLRAERERARQDRAVAVRREKRARERELRMLAILDDTEPSPFEREESMRRAAAARAARLSRLAKPNSRRKCNWTPGEERFLTAWWGLKPDEWVARQLGRTIDGCELRAWRLGVKRTDNHFGFEETLEVFGIVRNTLRKWIDRGWVGARKAQIRAFGRTRWSITEASLQRLVTERSWLVDPTKMKAGHYLTALAQEAHDRERWLTTAQVAERIHVSLSAVTRYLNRGYGTFVERPHHGGRGNVVWLMREGDLPALLARAEQAAAENLREGARRRVERLRARREGVPGVAA